IRALARTRQSVREARLGSRCSHDRTEWSSRRAKRRPLIAHSRMPAKPRVAGRRTTGREWGSLVPRAAIRPALGSLQFDIINLIGRYRSRSEDPENVRICLLALDPLRELWRLSRAHPRRVRSPAPAVPQVSRPKTAGVRLTGPGSRLDTRC